MKIDFKNSTGGVEVINFPLGLTVREMIDKMGNLGEVLDVWIKQPDGSPVQFERLPRLMWGYVRPKLDGVVCFAVRTGKSVLKTIIGIVGLIATIVAPYLSPLIGTLLLGGVALASLAVNYLFPSEANTGASPTLSVQNEAEAGSVLANVQSDSNPAAKGGYLPIAINRRISPPELTNPRFTLDDDRQVIERLFACDGHHAISDIYVDGAPITDYDAIESQIVEGADADPTFTFVNKCSKLDDIRARLSVFSLDGATLVNQDSPAKSEPTFTRFTTIGNAYTEEIVLRLQIDAFVKSDAPTTDLRLPFRIRFREKGSTGAWMNFPEIHITGRDQGSKIKEIRIRKDSDFGSANEAGDFGYEFFQRVPASGRTLSSGNTGDQWQADSYFVADTGLKDVQNIVGGRQGVRITMEEDFGNVAYEWEIQRGISLTKSALDASYQIGGVVSSLFEGYLSGQSYVVPVDQTAFNGSLTIQHSQVIVNQQPNQRPGTGLIAIKATDQSIQNVTAVYSRYVYDWDGTGWDTLTTTNNPATHARQIVYDHCIRMGVSTELIQDDAFVAWRQACIDNGWEMSTVWSGTGFGTAYLMCLSAGFARPIFSDIISVDWFRDRSAEIPKVSFSPANSTISINENEIELPQAIRAKFQNEADDYREDETEINNPFFTTVSGQGVNEYRAIANKTLIRKRAYFDLLQSVFQGRRTATVSSATQASLCEVGDIVLLITDLINDRAFGGIVRTVHSSTTLVMDQAPLINATTPFFDAANVFASSNIFEEGMQTYAWINHEDGGQELRVKSALVGEDGVVTVRFTSALTNFDLEGAHIVLGTKEQLSSRWIVLDADREAEERATLTLIPEAPEIFEYMEEFAA